MLAIALALPLFFAPALPQETRWPHTASDIPADPRAHFGVLPNGVRWAWLDNPEPKERCYLRLHVDVGSLAETDAQRGMAHFYEHMCFNGTKRHPGTSLVEWFQKQGMSFGGDTNAQTGFSDTTYMIDLPTCDETTLAEALDILRDDCDGLLLEPSTIDAEKGVIDAEERSRDSAEMRAWMAGLRIQYPGSRVADRMPIGDPRVRAEFDADDLRAFQSTWYRPENVTVVLVGDLRGKDPLPLVERAFGSLARPATPLAKEPPLEKAKDSPPFYVVEDDELSTTTISIQRGMPWKTRPKTKAQTVAELPLQVAHAILGLRFSELRKKEGAPFLGASAFDFYHGLEAAGLPLEDGVGMSVTARPETWREALALGENELRRAIEHGFASAELDEVRANMLRSLDEAVERAPTRSSAAWIADLVAAASHGSVPTTASARRELLKPAIQALDVAACQKALARAWSSGRLVVSVSGPLALGADGAREVEAAWTSALARRVEAPVTAKTKAFAHASDPAKAGKVAAREHVEDLDVHVATFENGVRLFVKQTDFKESEVLVCAAFGRGELDLGASPYAVCWVAERLFAMGGLTTHSSDELRRTLAGRNVGASLSAYEDRFELNGATTAQDLLLQCELMRARIEHAGWRTEGARVLAQQIPVIYENLAHKPGGPLALQFLPEVFSGDVSKGFPPREEIEAVTLDAAKAWLGPLLASSAIDVTIVGDVEVEDAVSTVARTFGAMPPRERAAAPEVEAAKVASGLRRRYEIDTEDSSGTVLVVFPTTDGRDIGTQRGLALLASIVSDRLRIEIREKLGESYSPVAQSTTSRARPQDGVLMIQVDANPAHTDAVVAAVLALCTEIAEKGLTDDEIVRAREPLEQALRDARRKNGYWWTKIAELTMRASALDEVRSEAQWLAGANAKDIGALAKRYLVAERANVAVVVPRAGAPKPSAPETGESVESGAPKKRD